MLLNRSKITHSSELQGQDKNIVVKFIKDKLCQALAAVSCAQADTEIGWIQIEFINENLVTFSSISHNISVKYEMELEHTGTGIVKIPGKQFSEYVRHLPNADIHINIEYPHRMVLRCSGSSAKIQLVQDQFSTHLIPVATGTSLTVSANLLDRWVSSFKDFVSIDDSRFYANGALLWADKDEGGAICLHAVASDAVRLASSTISDDESLKAHCIEGGAVIVPKRVLEELRRLSALDSEEKITLKWNSKELSFAIESSGYSLCAKCIAGVYPPYESAIPHHISSSVIVDLKCLSESLKRGLIFADRNKVMRLRFEASELTIEGITPGQKEGEEILQIQDPVQNSFEASYNGHLLNGILGALNGTKVILSWEGVNRPMKISGEDELGVVSFYLLVPSKF